MIEGRISFGDVVEYEDGHYTFERWVLSKHPETGDWYEAAAYQSSENGQRYVREKKDFLAKFTLVPQPVDDEILAQPMFDASHHCAWSGQCPKCDYYWESLDIERESPIKCDSCGENFKVVYPGGT